MSRFHTPLQQHEILTNCENYMSKLMKKKTSDKPRIVEKNCTCSTQSNQMPTPRSQKGNLVPFKNEEKPDSSRDQDLIHKEVLNNNMAQVEVTVRALPAKQRSRSNSGSFDKRETWAKLLQYKKSNDNLVNVNNFDYALGTIHFLSKELQHKLQSVCPGDASLAQIVNDIQHTLTRISPDGITEKASLENLNAVKNRIGDFDLNNAHKNTKVIMKPRRAQSTQTITEDGDAKELHKEKYLKLENSYKQMEDNYNKLQAEKLDIELELKLEKELVTTLKNEMEDKFAEKNDKSLNLIKQLREERDALERKLQESNNQKNDQESANYQELNSVIQKLKEDNQNIEYKNMMFSHEITIMKLEKEKLTFLLESREKQLTALRGEIESIQSMVCSHLYDMKEPKYLPLTSKSSLDSKSWRSVSQHRKLEDKEPIQELFLNKLKIFHNFKPERIFSSDNDEEKLSKKNISSTLKSRDFQDEYPQRDIPPHKSNKKSLISSKTVPSDLTVTSDLPDILKEDFETNIRDMFSELKRQALVALSSPAHAQESSDNKKS